MHWFADCDATAEGRQEKATFRCVYRAYRGARTARKAGPGKKSEIPRVALSPSSLVQTLACAPDCLSARRDWNGCGGR